VAPAAEAMGSWNWAMPCYLGLFERPVDLPLDAEVMERELLRLATHPHPGPWPSSRPMLRRLRDEPRHHDAAWRSWAAPTKSHRPP
jgi:hypothetical protein